MFKTFATAATVGMLCWPVMSFASPDYTERPSRTDSVASTQPKSLLSAVPAKSAAYTERASDSVGVIHPKPSISAMPATAKPKYNGYYGPTNGSTSRPTPLFLGLGGKW
jgi:hypothetical protein